MKERFSIFLSVCLLFVSCRPSVLQFDEVEYVTNSMMVQTKNIETVDLGLAGITDMRIRGPYIIVATSDPSGFVKVFDAETFEYLGAYFVQGNGPGELILPITASSMSFFREGDEWFAVFNGNKGHYIRFNISRSVESKVTVCEEYGEISGGTYQALDLRDGTFFFKGMSPDRNSQIRFLTRNNEKFVPEPFSRLNSAVLIPPKNDDGSYFNVLSSIIRYDAKTKWLYEASTELNTLHVYSEDGSFAKTFCIGDRIVDFNQAVKTDYGDRKRTFIAMDLFPEFCLALYKNSSLREMESGSDSFPTLFLFNIEEDVVVEISLPCNATSIALDQDRGYIYAVNQANEEVCRFMLDE